MAAKPPAREPCARETQSCPGMARALEKILGQHEQPEILDLGQPSGSAAVYLAGRGARVLVEDFQPPALRPPREPGSDELPVPPPPIEIPHPDEKFDLVLAWEHWDFVPPDRLAEFAAEVRRVLAPGGWLVLFAQDSAPAEGARSDRSGSYRLTADDRIERLPGRGPARPRWAHPNRAIEQALSPLSIQAIHLQRNRMREFLVRKPAADPGKTRPESTPD